MKHLPIQVASVKTAIKEDVLVLQRTLRARP